MMEANHAKQFVSENFCRLSLSENLSNNQPVNALSTNETKTRTNSSEIPTTSSFGLMDVDNNKVIPFETMDENELVIDEKSISHSINVLSEDTAKIMDFGPIRPLRRQRHSSHYVDFLVDDLVRKTRRLTWQSNTQNTSSALDLIALPTIGPHPLTDHRHLHTPKHAAITTHASTVSLNHTRSAPEILSAIPTEHHAHEVSHSEWFIPEDITNQNGQDIKSESIQHFADVDDSVTDDEYDEYESLDAMQT